MHIPLIQRGDREGIGRPVASQAAGPDQLALARPSSPPAGRRHLHGRAQLGPPPFLAPPSAAGYHVPKTGGWLRPGEGETQEALGGQATEKKVLQTPIPQPVSRVCLTPGEDQKQSRHLVHGERQAVN